jgi:hypothetical protein
MRPVTQGYSVFEKLPGTEPTKGGFYLHEGFAILKRLGSKEHKNSMKPMSMKL